MSHNKPYNPSYLLFVLFALVAFNLSIHIPFIITDSFGIVDAAKLANDCIKATYGGFHDLEYTINSGPFYYHVLSFLLKSHVISPPDIPYWMAMASLISNAIVTVSLFILVFRLTTSVVAALGASFILQLIPVFWYSGTYGFSTIVSLAFFMVSLVLFQIALDWHSGKRKYLLFAGALSLYVLAVATKLDIVFVSATYCFLVWKSREILRTRLIWIVCLASLAGVVFLLTAQYAEVLTIHQDTAYNTSDFGENFRKWGVSPGLLLSKENLIITAEAVGILSIPFAALATVLIGWRKEWRSTIIWLMLSSLPLVLFWGTRPGNSGRHNLIPSVFLCIVLALPFTVYNWKRWAWAVLLCGVILINYFYFSPYAGQRSSSGNLLASSVLHKERVKYPHLAGKRIALLPYQKIAFIGSSLAQSFFRFELLSSNEFEYVSHTRPSREVSTLEMKNGNQRRSYLWLYTAEMSEIYSLVERGYFLVIGTNKLAGELNHLNKLKGKWVSLYQFEPKLAIYKMNRS